MSKPPKLQGGPNQAPGVAAVWKVQCTERRLAGPSLGVLHKVRRFLGFSNLDLGSLNALGKFALWRNPW